MAITKERLKELIEQEATVCIIDSWGVIWEEKLSQSHFVGIADEEESLMRQYTLNDADLIDYIRNIYENKEDAEFVAKYHTSIVEKFEPPTYEEFVEMEEWCFFQKNHTQTIIRVLGTKYLGVETNFERYFTGDLSKENYIKAVEKAKKLFLGESR